MEDIVLPSLENLSTSSMLKTHSHIYSPDFCSYILAKSCLLVCVHACVHSCMYAFSFLVWLCNWPLEISNYKSVGNEDFQGRRMRRSRFPLQRNCLCLGHYIHGISRKTGASSSDSSGRAASAGTGMLSETRQLRVQWTTRLLPYVSF